MTSTSSIDRAAFDYPLKITCTRYLVGRNQAGR